MNAPLTLRVVTQPSRALVLASSTNALVFRPPPPTGSSRASAQVVVEYLPLEQVDLAEAGKLTKCYGCLGLVQLDGEVFLSVVTSTSSLGSLLTAQPISRILGVEFCCLTSSTYDYSAHGFASAQEDGSFASSGAGYALEDSLIAQQHASNAGLYEHPCSGMKKILANGHFYYSTAFDLSSRLEVRASRSSSASEDGLVYDPRFLWNSYLVDALLGYREDLPPDMRQSLDSQGFLVLAIQGFAGAFDLYVPAGDPASPPLEASISLISRLGWHRAGTRFNTRGVDDSGHVANFAETECLVTFPSQGSTFSYVQIRGSVPVFFEQSGTGVQNVLTGLSGQGQKVTVTRAGPAAQPAFNRHFDDILQHYQSVKALNLLGTREGESSLSSAYLQAIRSMPGQMREKVGLVHFDFHSRTKVVGLEGVRSQLSVNPEVGGWASGAEWCMVMKNEKGSDEVVRRQHGVFRTNCLDCLDRTNVVQDMLCRITLEHYLNISMPHLVRHEQLWNVHRTLWADNGDALSKIYAGTGALNTSFTRGGKQTFGGILSNATKSVGRMYISNFVDKGKQAAIDALLGSLVGQQSVSVFDPIAETVNAVVRSRKAEYASAKGAKIWVGTWNVNGRASTEDLRPWLCPEPGLEPDIRVVAFQEIVKLSPQQIMATDPEKRRRWEAAISVALNMETERGAPKYVLLRSEQLVGAALMVYVKAGMVDNVRHVEGTTKKTGLKGMAGNKGAVAIRLEWYDSAFCFVTAHFAAGHSNVEERNKDYTTIVEGLSFLKGKTIRSHETVIWAGDFNYRVDLSNDEVRPALETGDIATPFAMDQLSVSLGQGLVFAGYREGPVTFPPTYKFDNGTERYDTSEKMRVPAWTDRILYRGEDLSMSAYHTAPLFASDHRPVFAVLDAQVSIVDRERKEAVRHEVVDNLQAGGVFDQIQEIVESGGGELKAPSGDAGMWWNGPDHLSGTVDVSPALLARVTGRSTNPFDPAFLAPEHDTSTDHDSEPAYQVSRSRASLGVASGSPSLSASGSGVRRPPPPRPVRPSSRATSPSTPPLLTSADASPPAKLPGTAAMTAGRKPPPPAPPRTSGARMAPNSASPPSRSPSMSSLQSGGDSAASIGGSVSARAALFEQLGKAGSPPPPPVMNRKPSVSPVARSDDAVPTRKGPPPPVPPKPGTPGAKPVHPLA